MSEILHTPKKEFLKPGVTLRDVIEAKNIKGKDPLPIAKDTVVEWHKIAIPKIKEMFAKHPELEYSPLEIEKVITGDANINLLGASPLGVGRTPNHFSDKINNHIIKSSREGTNWYTAQRVGKVNGIEENVTELTDISVYLKSALTQNSTGIIRFYKLAKSIGSEYWNTVRSGTLFQNKYLEKIYNKPPTWDPVLKSKTEIFAIRQKIEDMAKLPEPLDMEIGMILANGNNFEKNNITIDKPYLQARQLEIEITKLKSNGIKTPVNVGLITESGEKSRVAYFLTHPGYNPHRSLSSALERLKK